MSAKPVNYRDLRNAPAKVFERLAAGDPLELVADGTTKAILIPVSDGDAASAIDAWMRGRALLALGRVQSAARRDGTAELSLSEINREIKAVRASRRSRERERQHAMMRIVLDTNVLVSAMLSGGGAFGVTYRGGAWTTVVVDVARAEQGESEVERVHCTA